MKWVIDEPQSFRISENDVVKEDFQKRRLPYLYLYGTDIGKVGNERTEETNSSITNVNHPNAINNGAKDLWKGLTYDYQEHVTISSNDSSGRSDDSNEADIRKKLYIEDLTTRKDVYGLCGECFRPGTGRHWCQTYIERHQTNSDIQIQMQKYVSVRVDKLNCNSNDNRFKITRTHPQAIYASRSLNFKDLPKPVNAPKSALDSLQINDE
ncbi:3622_t:CDS:2, partial [Funneliformis mosseae]